MAKLQYVQGFFSCPKRHVLANAGQELACLHDQADFPEGIPEGIRRFGLANLTYNMQRMIWLTDGLATA
jgi:hypothetical protein